ncbi:MAG: bifunctional oligoribonuclease/PAP phosphatase NrnA [Bacilli bacterium]|jgi:nanoRNase/pAp phosphatase (c-di-AMP/oligoRNAs hydrolase)|nr:bifunctional oligoribonuclease/PAP phosphatase NrnA [Bacilli bacterium]
MNEIFNKIEEYDSICIFTHQFPDPDALGSQFGLKQFILDNFNNKKVYALGKNNDSLNGTTFPRKDKVNDEVIQSSLAIVLDTANTSRIDDERYNLAREIIKIDHHPIVEQYGNINLVEVDKCATSFILANLIKNSTYTLSSIASTYFFIGIVGDTGRFLHNNTTSEVFAMASYLLDNGVDLTKSYENLYKRSVNDTKLVGYILQNYQIIGNRLAYYILEKEDYEQFDICFEKAKEHVNVLADIEGIDIWVSVVYSEDTGFYHVSIRSKHIQINDVAQAMGGGGHKFASGIKATSLARVQTILDNLVAKLF